MTHPPMTGRPSDYVTHSVVLLTPGRTYAAASHCRVFRGASLHVLQPLVQGLCNDCVDARRIATGLYLFWIKERREEQRHSPTVKNRPITLPVRALSSSLFNFRNAIFISLVTLAGTNNQVTFALAYLFCEWEGCTYTYVSCILRS